VTILAVTGLRREAAILQGPGLKVVVGGGRAGALEAMLAGESAAEGMVSIGLGGALVAGLSPGDWVAATAVVSEAGAWPTDPLWTEEIVRRLAPHSRGPVLGSDRMLVAAAEKEAAHRRWDALVVDMESHIAARAAQRLGAPFAAVRVVSDAADEDLPPAVLVGMKPDGGMALGAVLADLARNPRQLPALLRAGRDAGAAFRALADGRRLLGPRIGLADLVELPLHVG
jgi:hopanoid-associated phosphorylase